MMRDVVLAVVLAGIVAYGFWLMSRLDRWLQSDRFRSEDEKRD